MNCIALSGNKVTFKANFNAEEVWKMTTVKILDTSNAIGRGWFNQKIEIKIGGFIITTFDVKGKTFICKPSDDPAFVKFVEPEPVKFFKYLDDEVESLAEIAIKANHPDFWFTGIKKPSHASSSPDGSTFDGGVIAKLSAFDGIISTSFYDTESSKKRDFPNSVVKSTIPMDDGDFAVLIKSYEKEKKNKMARYPKMKVPDYIANIYFPRMKVPVGYKYADIPSKFYPLAEDNIKDTMKSWSIDGVVLSLYGLNFHPSDTSEKNKPCVRYYLSYASCSPRQSSSAEDDFFANLESEENEEIEVEL